LTIERALYELKHLTLCFIICLLTTQNAI